MIEAHFPRIKRLADFDLGVAPTVNPATVATLAGGGYMEAGDRSYFWVTAAPGKATCS